MTASRAIARPIPGTQPLPESEELPTPVDGAEEEPPRRRRRRILLLFLLLAGFVALLGLTIWYLLFRQPLPIPVIPGQVVMPTYTTSIYGADRPMGVAVSADGSRIYIGATEGDRTARVFDASGNQLAVMQPPLSTGNEHVPVYLAVDPLNGEVYITDRPTGSIYIYDANGTFQRAVDPGPTLKGWQPLGITFDAAGNLYVTDVASSPQAVLVFDRSGALTRTLGKAEGLNFPNGVAVDSSGTVYVTDSSNGRLLVFDPAGSLVAQVGRGTGQGNLGLPRGVAIDGKGRVYVVDTTGQGGFVYSTVAPAKDRLEYLGYFGGQGISDGTFQYPNGVAVDARGRIYVADSGNDRVQLWSY